MENFSKRELNGGTPFPRRETTLWFSEKAIPSSFRRKGVIHLIWSAQTEEGNWIENWSISGPPTNTPKKATPFPEGRERWGMDKEEDVKTTSYFNGFRTF